MSVFNGTTAMSGDVCQSWRRRTAGQLKMWITTIKADLEPLSGPRVIGYVRWRTSWVQDPRAWSASIRDVINFIGDAGSTRPGY